MSLIRVRKLTCTSSTGRQQTLSFNAKYRQTVAPNTKPRGRSPSTERYTVDSSPTEGALKK